MVIIRVLKRWFNAAIVILSFIIILIASVPIILDSNSAQKALSGFITSHILQVSMLDKIKPDKIKFYLFPYPSVSISNIKINNTILKNCFIDKIYIEFSLESFFLESFSVEYIFKNRFLIKKVIIQNPKIPIFDSLFKIPFESNKQNIFNISLFDFFSDEQKDFYIEIENLKSDIFDDIFNKADIDILISPHKNIIAINISKEQNPSEEQNPFNPFFSSLSATFQFNKKEQKNSLLFSGKDLNINNIRPIVLKELHNNKISNIIFDIIRGGNAKAIDILFKGSEESALFTPYTMTIKAELENGTIKIPSAHKKERKPAENLKYTKNPKSSDNLKSLEADDFELISTNIHGTVDVKNGILHTKILSGNINPSKVTAGNLDVNLLNSDHNFDGEFHISADIAHIKTVLQNLFPNTRLSRELALTSSINGKTKGIFKIKGGKHQKPSIYVNADNIDMDCRYERLPKAISISRGQFIYSGKMITIKNLNAEIGASNFSNINSSLTLDKNYFLKINSEKLQIELKDFLRWFYYQFDKYSQSAYLSKTESTTSASSQFFITKYLLDIINSTGILNFKETAFQGNLLNISTWDYFIQGNCESIALKSTLNVNDISDIKADFVLSPYKSEIYISNAVVNDISSISSILSTVILSAAGEAHYSSKLISDIKTPFNLKDISFKHIRDISFKQKINKVIKNNNSNIAAENRINCKGELIFNKNNQPDYLYFDLHKNNLLNDFNAVIKIGGSKIGDNKIGDNKKEYASILLSKNSDQSQDVYFQGIITTKHIERFLNPASETYKKFIALTGGKNFTIESKKADDYVISTDNLNLDFILKRQKLNILLPLPHRTEKKEPLTITFNCKSLNFKNYNISPFSASININSEKKTKNIEIKNSKICNINCSAEISIKNNLLQISGSLLNTNENIEPTINCFYNGRELIQGNYSLKSSFYTEGKIKDISNNKSDQIDNKEVINKYNKNVISSNFTDSANIKHIDMDQYKKNLNGKIHITSNGGRIFRLTLLSRILSVINISKLIEGKFPDIEQNGFEFSSIKIDADIENGAVFLKHAVIKGVDMTLIFIGAIDIFTREIDLTCLVAPLKTADNIIEKIPIINKMLDGRLISIPVKAAGSINNPNVIVLDPSEVGKSILNTMKDILTTPFQLINIIE